MQEITTEIVESIAETSALDVIDQPGGAISLRGGVLVNTMTVQEAAASSLSFIGERFSWLAPLLESVAI